jgi:cell pole-organizing protein PopZ
MEEILASIRRIIADDQDGARATAPAAPSPPPHGDDVLDLAEARSTPADGPETAPEHEDVPFRDREQPDAFEAPPDDDVPEPPAAHGPPRAPSRAPPPRAEPDVLLSGSARATAANAFQVLSTTVLNSNPRTLEDLVREMLRPMLKAWLDDNLPPLVERLVRAEIERVSRNGR